jgi:hypothetical protein
VSCRYDGDGHGRLRKLLRQLPGLKNGLRQQRNQSITAALGRDFQFDDILLIFRVEDEVPPLSLAEVGRRSRQPAFRKISVRISSKSPPVRTTRSATGIINFPNTARIIIMAMLDPMAMVALVEPLSQPSHHHVPSRVLRFTGAEGRAT